MAGGEKTGPPKQRPVGKDNESTTEDDVNESATEDARGESVTEVASVMSEDGPDERETGQRMWLVDKVWSLEKENGELKKTLQETRETVSVQERTIKEIALRFTKIESAITQIAEHAQRHPLDIEVFLEQQ